jgi:hypothetical protein
MRIILAKGTSSNNSGNSFCRKSTYARPVRQFGKTAGPIKWLSITEKRCWKFPSMMACGFLSYHWCELWVYAPASNSCISTANENYTHAYANLFTRNSPYYHLFLLKHCVCVCVCMYVCMYVYMYVCIYIYIMWAYHTRRFHIQLVINYCHYTIN